MRLTREQILKKIDDLRVQWFKARVSDRPLIERRAKLLKQQLKILNNT